MTLLNYTYPARVVRRVSVDEAGVIVVEDDIGPWFTSQLVDLKGGSRNDEPSPRSRPIKTLRFFSGVLGPVGDALTAGDRVGIRDVVYELIEDPRLIVDGGDPTFDVSVQDITRLYPRLGQLQEMDGTVVAGTRFAAYAPRETHETRGTYEDYTIDCPIDLHDQVRSNRQFAAGTDLFKITAATVDKVGGYVSVNARRSGRG